MRIILASQSPRRRELLAQMGVQFEAIPSNFDEHLDNNRTPEAVASQLALDKALTLARQYPDSLVIGSDTIVTIDGKQLEKPRDREEAKAILKHLSGKANEVSTGLAVVCIAQGIQLVGADTTKVYFRPYDGAAVDAYVATGDSLDKAGAYGIQSGAAPLIDHIEGNYDTVIGFPTKLLAEFLAQLGVEAHAVALQAPVEQKVRVHTRA